MGWESETTLTIRSINWGGTTPVSNRCNASPRTRAAIRNSACFDCIRVRSRRYGMREMGGRVAAQGGVRDGVDPIDHLFLPSRVERLEAGGNRGEPLKTRKYHRRGDRGSTCVSRLGR